MRRWRYWAWFWGQVFTTILLPPAIAWANDCGGPNDCWGTLKGAAAAAVGAAAVAAVAALFGWATGDTQNPGPPPAESGDEPVDDPCYQ